MSRYALQDGLDRPARSKCPLDDPPGVPLRSLFQLPGRVGYAGRNLNRVRQDGVGILERTRKREGWGAAVGSSWRTFGAPRPVLSPGLTQRDMEREDPPRPPRPPADPADPADPGAVGEMTFSAQHCTLLSLRWSALAPNLIGEIVYLY